MLKILMLLLGGLALAAIGRVLWWNARGSSTSLLPRRPEAVASYASFVLALVVSLTLLFGPVYTEEIGTSETSARGTIINKPIIRHPSMLQVDHANALLFVGIPMLLVCLPLLFRRSRWRGLLEGICATVLIVFSLVPFSIGFFYLPSAVAMLVAAVQARPAHASA